MHPTPLSCSAVNNDNKTVLGSPEHSAGGRAISKSVRKCKGKIRWTQRLISIHPCLPQSEFHGTQVLPSSPSSLLHRLFWCALWNSFYHKQIPALRLSGYYAYNADLVLTCPAICQPSGHSPTFTEDVCSWPFLISPASLWGNLSSHTGGLFNTPNCGSEPFGYKV